MGLWYRVEVQMAGENTMNDELIFKIKCLFPNEFIEEDEGEYSTTFKFYSTVLPTNLLNDFILPYMTGNERIHYMDVEFIWNGEFHPDRYVVWNNGTTTHYTGHEYYTEDKA